MTHIQRDSIKKSQYKDIAMGKDKDVTDTKEVELTEQDLVTDFMLRVKAREIKDNTSLFTKMDKQIIKGGEGLGFGVGRKV